jgi:hypothetical protein
MEDSIASLRGRGSASRGPLGRLVNMMNSVSSSMMPDSIWTAKSNYAYDTRLLYKRKITELFIAFSSLRSYVEVNYSGFRKILKKCANPFFSVHLIPYLLSFFRYDKVTYSEVRRAYFSPTPLMLIARIYSSKIITFTMSSKMLSLLRKPLKIVSTTLLTVLLTCTPNVLLVATRCKPNNN